MLSVTELISGISDVVSGLATVYQYYAMVLGTIVTCYWVGRWGLNKKGK